jgi:hypothetical protein
MRLQRHRRYKRRLVAAARKLALILHAMWRDGSEFRFGQAPERRPEGRSSVPRRLENGRAMTAWGRKNRWGILCGDEWIWWVRRRRRAQYRAYCRAAERPSERA